MKCLNKFSYNEFKDFIDELDLSYWTVWNTNIEERLARCITSNRFQYLLNLAKEKGLQSSPAEILSWLDSLKILKETLKEVPQNILDKLTIIQEYQIPFSRKRADYLLIFQNKVLILEFSFKYDDTETQFENKTIQILGYKERLIDLLPSHIEIGTYTYLIYPELEPDTYEDILRANKYTEIEDLANSENNNSLASYITLFFNKERDSALSHLCHLDAYETTAINEIKNKRENEIRIQHKLQKKVRDMDEEEIFKLEEKYLQIYKEYPDFVIIIQDKDIENLFYVFNEDIDKINSTTILSNLIINKILLDNEIFLYRAIKEEKETIIRKVTEYYNLAIGTCLEDLEFYDKISEKKEEAEIRLLLKKYKKMVDNYPEFIIAIQNKDTYEIYGENAKKVSNIISWGTHEKSFNNETITYFKIHKSNKDYLKNKITKQYNIAFGTCLEDLEFYYKTK